MSTTAAVHRSFRRQIHLEDEIWRYKVGDDNVLILSPAGRKIEVRIHVLQGRDWEGYERDREKGNWPGVKPSEIKAWIAVRKNMLVCL